LFPGKIDVGRALSIYLRLHPWGRGVRLDPRSHRETAVGGGPLPLAAGGEIAAELQMPSASELDERPPNGAGQVPPDQGNHYHLLIETPTAGLSRGMRFLKGRYTQ